MRRGFPGLSLSTRTRLPRPRSIVTTLGLRRARCGGAVSTGWSGDVEETASVIVTGTNCAEGNGAGVMLSVSVRPSEIVQSCLRQRNNWLTWQPADRATSDTLTPGSRQAATSRSLSSCDHRRRRSIDVITSICCLVI